MPSAATRPRSRRASATGRCHSPRAASCTGRTSRRRTAPPEPARPPPRDRSGEETHDRKESEMTTVTTTRFTVGDTVELRDAPFDTVGTIVSVIRPDHVRVEWNTGQGYRGKTTLLSVRVLKRWGGRCEPRMRRGEARAPRR